MIIDLRRTAEGPIDNGIAAARLFVKSGTLVQEGGRDPKAATKIAAKAGDGAIDAPVWLLVTTGTSGAAEVFAAALDGNKRADLVGEHTLGRAGLQKLVKLPENRGLWLTYARYLTPDGQPIHGKGLEPDVPGRRAGRRVRRAGADDGSDPRRRGRARQGETRRLNRAFVLFVFAFAPC